MAGVTASFDPIAYLPACASKAWLTRLQIHNYTSVILLALFDQNDTCYYLYYLPDI